MKNEDSDILCFIALLTFIVITFITGIQIGKWEESKRAKIQHQMRERP